MPTLKIKNWKLAVLAFMGIALLTWLGIWQLQRAQQKKLLLATFAARTAQAPVTAAALSNVQDWRFYQVTLDGYFDNAHSLLLDNKIFHGVIGYEVYTPFNAKGLPQPILVDRGFIPLGKSRATLPLLPALIGRYHLSGMLNLPSTYIALGRINESATLTWPLRIEYINLREIMTFMPHDQARAFFPYLLLLPPKHEAAFAVEWQVATMGPERHLGYAVQWFALALTLLILFVVLNWANEIKDGSL